MKTKALYIMILMIVPCICYGFNGNEWVKCSPVIKDSYIKGLYGGMYKGIIMVRKSMWDEDREISMKHALDDNNFSDDDKKQQKIRLDFIGNVIKRTQKLPIVTLNEKITGEQLILGIDTFYKDYRNRLIEVVDAYSIVLKEINIEDRKRIDEEIMELRELANKEHMFMQNEMKETKKKNE